jgi:hypothetical protein
VVNSIAVITAISNFFRTVGGVFGIAIFGTIYQNDLINQLYSMNLTVPATVIAQNFEIVKTLPEPARQQVQEAFVTSLDKMRLVIIPFAGVSFIASLFIEHFELRKRPGGQKAPPPAAANVEEEKKEGVVDTSIDVAQTVGEDGTGTAIPEDTLPEKSGSVHESL